MKKIKIVSLCFVVLLISACSQSTDPTPPPVTQPPLKSIYFYSEATNANIMAFDPATSTSSMITTNGSKFRQAFSNPSNTATVGVLYVENGMFYKVAADKFGTVTTQQLTSTTNNTDICRNVNNYGLDYLFFKKPGNDGICGTNADVGPFAVHSGMTLNSTFLKPDVYPLTPIVMAAGLDGWLVYNTNQTSNTLLKANLDFTTLKPIATGFAAPNAIVVNKTDNGILLNLDNEFRFYDNATESLGATLHTVVNAGGVITSIVSGSTLYFNDGIAIYSLLLDGTNTKAAAINSDVAGETVTLRAVSGDILIYTTTTLQNPSASQRIRSLNVNDKKVNTVVARENASQIEYRYVYGSRIYFNRKAGTSNTANMILADGTVLKVLPNSLWIGETATGASDADVLNQKILLKSDLADQTNFNLITYNGLKYEFDPVQVTLPTINTVTSFAPTGTAGLGILNGNVGTLNDIYYIDLTNKNSFIRVTETDTVSELLIQ